MRSFQDTDIDPKNFQTKDKRTSSLGRCFAIITYQYLLSCFRQSACLLACFKTLVTSWPFVTLIMTFLTTGPFFLSRSIQILVRVKAVLVYAEEHAMYKAMDTAVTVCHLILVATARVSTKNLGHYSLNNTCVPGRESGKRFSTFFRTQYLRIYKKTPQAENHKSWL